MHLTLKDKLFIWKCIKNEPHKGCFLLSTKRYKVGDFITYSGTPTKDINNALISTLNDYNLFEICKECGFDSRGYFELIEVKLKL